MGRKANFTASDKRKIQAMLISILEKTPFVTSACKKVGITRMTLHRWQEKDKDFAHDVKKAISLSREDINDLAESKLLENVQNKHMGAIRFWLENNHPLYKRVNRQELEIEQKNKDEDTIFLLPDNHLRNYNQQKLLENNRERHKKRLEEAQGKKTTETFYKSKGGQDHLRDNS